MKISRLPLIFFVILSCSCAAIANEHQDFLECLASKFKNYSSISNDVYTPRNSSYTSVLQFSVKNLRYATKSTPKPQVIITPEDVSQIPPIIQCAKESGLQIRTRSGGHDYEGQSYVAYVPYVIVDLIKISGVSVNAEEKTAWVEGGATLGSVYYKISQKSPTLGFPAGVCPPIGVGGHISGGGYGMMLRKYGLAADHVVDAKIIDVNGRILDRKSMGKDLFWAIRGGGGASFGIIIGWKLQLVDVPKTVTVFRIQKTLEQNATRLFDRWQHVAHEIDRDLFISVIITQANSTQIGRDVTVSFLFKAVFLGGADRLLGVMQERFPDLGLVRKDCIEMSWIQAILFYYGMPIGNLEALLNRSQTNTYFKAKLDYVQRVIPVRGLEGMWTRFFQAEAKTAQLITIPYGGRMAEISESVIPFPNRAGNLYNIQHMVQWNEEETCNSNKYMDWVRSFDRYLTPYVSRSPRVGYINCRDLDFGVNPNRGDISYAQASRWGLRYFKNNFNRLIRIKTMVDPTNFFRNEQSIPAIPEGRR